MLRKNFILALPLLLISLPLSAGEFHLDNDVIGQVRKNTSSQREIPVNEYFGMSFAQPSWHLGGETNMREFRDFDRKLDEFDLYQTVIHYTPLEALQIDAGRQFVNQGFFVETLDGIQTTVAPWKYVDFIAYSGIPRSVEVGDFNKNDGLITGVSIGSRNLSRTNIRVHGAWRKINIHWMDVKHNDEVFVSGNFSHQFAVSSTPMLYGFMEYNTAAKVLDVGTAGFDIYPTGKIRLNLEFNYFNTNRQSDRTTVQALYTAGRMMGGRFSSTWTLVYGWLDLIENYSFRNTEVLRNDFRNSHLADASLRFTANSIGLSITPGYYYERSFGGHLNGAKTNIHEQFTDKFYANLLFDFTKYKKITNNNDNAYSVTGWTGYEVAKGLTLSGGFEYNKNSFFNKDSRGSFRVDYHFDRGS
ncbi:MAG: hypothetical protein HY877_04190 [Deltaproteobacteria bacterium]|nr:hypothetical protein [Deltaproteobacteria bacterium]